MKVYVKNVWDSDYTEIALEDLKECLDYEINTDYLIDDIDDKVIYITRKCNELLWYKEED